MIPNPRPPPRAARGRAGKITPLDLAAKIDETASFLVQKEWGEIDFPAPFGRPEFPEEKFIRDMDAKTGASLKLTILNHTGRVWTMVAGGGASVVYADTVSDLGFAHELANYGEYSGAPNDEQTFAYARTILGLMTRNKDPRGKVLIIGGGIANFTDVAATFKGIIQAIKHYAEEIRDGNIKIYVNDLSALPLIPRVSLLCVLFMFSISINIEFPCKSISIMMNCRVNHLVS